MKIHIEQDPGELTPEDLTELISVLMEHIEEHFLHEECHARCLKLDLIIEKLAWMLPTDPQKTWLDEWRESWERSR